MIPTPTTSAGAAGLAAILAEPARALLAFDFDGVLAPIVDDPTQSRAHPRMLPALARIAPHVGAIAIVTGRPAEVAVGYGGLAGAPGLDSLVVFGHYGSQRWDARTGELTGPPAASGGGRRPGRAAATAGRARTPVPSGWRTRAAPSLSTHDGARIHKGRSTGCARRSPAWPSSSNWPSNRAGWSSNSVHLGRTRAAPWRPTRPRSRPARSPTPATTSATCRRSRRWSRCGQHGVPGLKVASGSVEVTAVAAAGRPRRRRAGRRGRPAGGAGRRPRPGRPVSRSRARQRQL